MGATKRDLYFWYVQKQSQKLSIVKSICLTVQKQLIDVLYATVSFKRFVMVSQNYLKNWCQHVNHTHRYLAKEGFHAGFFCLNELIHEGHELFFSTKPAIKIKIFKLPTNTWNLISH